MLIDISLHVLILQPPQTSNLLYVDESQNLYLYNFQWY